MPPSRPTPRRAARRAWGYAATLLRLIRPVPGRHGHGLPVRADAHPRPLVLIELNEINFDLVRAYVAAAPAKFTGLSRLLALDHTVTRAEEPYEQLEPWIQWVSVYTGQSFAEHQVFRLGDIVHSAVPQLFEQLEQQGLRVGVVAAMNARNSLRAPAYFIPDPWTRTPADPSLWSRALGRAIAQAVNDNAQAKLTPASALTLGLGLLRFASPRNRGLYLKLLGRARTEPWAKALLLDLLLHDVHRTFLRTRAPHFSTLFLNGGAHIQHHYLASSAAPGAGDFRNPAWYVAPGKDPVADMLVVYDRIIGQCLDLANAELIVATGLSQTPYDRVKFYYRLKDHALFLKTIGVGGARVTPRMTRDFLLDFASGHEAARAAQALGGITVQPRGLPLFRDIDNRGSSLFVTLTYPHEITAADHIEVGGERIPLRPHVAFVAIKNGMHQGKGFAFFTPGVAGLAPATGSHVRNLYHTIRSYFAHPDRA